MRFKMTTLNFLEVLLTRNLYSYTNTFKVNNLTYYKKKGTFYYVIVFFSR